MAIIVSKHLKNEGWLDLNRSVFGLLKILKDRAGSLKYSILVFFLEIYPSKNFDLWLHFQLTHFIIIIKANFWIQFNPATVTFMAFYYY